MKTCALLFVLVASSACIVAAAGPPPVVAAPSDGAIAFDWSFAGDTSCVDADVSDLDVDIVDPGSGDVVVSDHGEVCSGAGLTISGVPEGSYDVDLTAFDPRGNAIFAGSFGVDVVGGETSDVGLITLDPPGGPGGAG